MVREDNKAIGKTSLYGYDTNGNILCKSVYAFTLGDVMEKTPLSAFMYSYRGDIWRDRMTAFNGEKCVYDAMGRPTTYRNKTLAWNGYGTLTSYNGNTYTYDANGIRLTKIANGVDDFFCKAGKILGGFVVAAVSGVAALVSLPFTSILPGFGGFITQTLFSISMYGGFMAASVWDEKVNSDTERINWNPFNTDENAVLNSSKASFYKGAPVFRTNFSRSGTFLGIFLRRSGADVDEVRHEWGHTIQQGLTGPAIFGLTFAITSSAKLSKRSYYDRPWEITADIFGGVQWRTHSSKNERKGWGYLAAAVMCFPLSYLFLIGEY